MKYFIHLAYKGTKYHGWQRQPLHVSIQSTLEDMLEKMIGEKVACIGCGRTDAGVHASQFYCHIKLSKPFSFDPVFRLNKMLPDDIIIYEFIEVEGRCHAQHDAVSRTYTYRIHTKEDPFISELSSYYTGRGLDLTLMQQAANVIPNYTDFRSMCKHPDFYKTTQCHISSVTLTGNKDLTNLTFTITSNRFLRGMIRLLVGNLLQVAYKKMSVQQFENCLKTGERPGRYNLAQPQGLYLSKVTYSFLAYNLNTSQYDLC